MEDDCGYLFGLLDEVLHLVLEGLGGRVDRILDVPSDKVVVSHVNDDVVRVRTLVALDECCELLCIVVK